MRDGSGVIQCTLRKQDVDLETFKMVEKLPLESTLELWGRVKRDERAPDGWEIQVTRLGRVFRAMPDYPIDMGLAWYVLAGTEYLHPVRMVAYNMTGWAWFVVLWGIMGVVTAPIATSRGNCIRTALWMGALVLLLSLTSILLQDPTLWTGDRDVRNWALFLHFIGAVIGSTLSIPSGMAAMAILEYLHRERRVAPPAKIETICTCGAVFKSNPLICAYCGRTLREGTAETDAEEVSAPA